MADPLVEPAISSDEAVPSLNNEESKPPVTGTSLSSSNPADLVGKWALCDMGYGWVRQVDSDQNTATVELPFGMCYVPISSLQFKLAVTVQTFYKKEDQTVPTKVQMDIDLNQPISAIFEHLASIYKIGPQEMILVNGPRHLKLPEPLDENVKETNKNQASIVKKKPKSKTEKQKVEDAEESQPADDQKQAPLNYPPLPPFDLCSPQSSHHRLLLIVDERALFRFQYVNDKNGIIYHLGTEGRNGVFTNPAQMNKVQVRMSTSGGDSASCIFDRVLTCGSAENSYGAEPQPWIDVTFVEYLVQPNFYVVCQRGDHMLRNWTLEGSMGGGKWDALDTRVNDQTIDMDPSGAYASGAFPVRNCRKFYRSLRIRLIGPSHKGSHDFDITQLEFYGSITPLNKQ